MIVQLLKNFIRKSEQDLLQVEAFLKYHVAKNIQKGIPIDPIFYGRQKELLIVSQNKLMRLLAFIRGRHLPSILVLS